MLKTEIVSQRAMKLSVPIIFTTIQNSHRKLTSNYFGSYLTDALIRNSGSN